MSRVMRKRARVSYYEPEEPGFDEYVFCTNCGDYVYEYCCIHGPLLVVPDDEVPYPTGYPAFVPRAALTTPRMFLHLAPSTIPDAGIGVFSTLTLPRGVRFGPYRGVKTYDSDSPYCWQIFDRDHKPSHIMDARDANKSNWMRYVNCSRHYSEQNLVAFQYQGQLYYRTIKIIPRFTELLVFYGSEFASELNVDLRRYHSPVYTETIVKCSDEKSHVVEQLKQLAETSTDIEHVRQTLELQECTQRTNKEYQQSLTSNSHHYLDEQKENDDPNDETEKQYACDHCSETYNEKSVFLAHLQAHSKVNKKPIKKNTCTICNITFTTKSDHINHEIKIHNSDIKYKACPICDFKTTGSHLKEHIIRHGSKIYKCNICSFETKTNQDLMSHGKRHTKEENKPCATCGKQFRNTKHLNRHVKIHVQERLYICTICSKAFRQLFHLKRHMKIHSPQEKKYACMICEKRFSDVYGLKRHNKTHGQEKPYVCMTCYQAFRDAYNLERHTKSVHAINTELRETVI